MSVSKLKSYFGVSILYVALSACSPLKSNQTIGNSSSSSLEGGNGQCNNLSAPLAPTQLQLQSALSTRVSISWQGSASDGVTNYLVSRDGNQIANVSASQLSYLDSGLTAATLYKYTVSTQNNCGMAGAQSNLLQVTTLAAPETPDAVAPAVNFNVPVNGSTLTAGAPLTIQISAIDNVGVIGVNIFVNGNLICALATAPYNCKWSVPTQASANYSLMAKAWDASGNMGVASVMVSTPANVPTPGNVSSVSQFGITWTFDKPYPVGQFVGGDYYVVGPVTIVSVTPGWNGQTNGSMLDPQPVAAQGFDSRITAYYKFDDTVRIKFPITISGIKSLVSVVGLAQNKIGGAYEALSSGAVLTILNQVPPAGTFRPPYVAGNKPLWNISQINYQTIPTLTLPAGTTVPTLTDIMTRPGFQFGPTVWGTTIAPVLNLTDPYPAYNCRPRSKMALAMMLDTPKKQDYIQRYIQQGIDLYSIVLRNDTAFEANGGFGVCYKLPILVAGLALNDPGMKSPPLYSTSNSALFKFSEDGYTYFGAPTSKYPTGKPMFGIDWVGAKGLPLSICNSNCMARDPNGVLYPEQMSNGGDYRQLTSNTFVGQALAARLLKIIPLWNHQAFFDYEDQWVSDPSSWGDSSDQYKRDVYGYGDETGFIRRMWETYR